MRSKVAVLSTEAVAMSTAVAEAVMNSNVLVEEAMYSGIR